MPSLTFWIGYGVLTILTVTAAATGRNVFLVAIANSIIALLWWAADAVGYDIYDRDYGFALGWGVLLFPVAVVASILSTGIGRVAFSHKTGSPQTTQAQARQSSATQELDDAADERRFLQKQALLAITFAIVLGVGEIIADLQDEHSTIYFLVDHLLGGVAFGWGCMQYARTRGRTRWWALLGILWALPGGRLIALISFVLLVSLAAQANTSSVSAKRP
jgi:hypothetical protein